MPAPGVGRGVLDSAADIDSQPAQERLGKLSACLAIGTGPGVTGVAAEDHEQGQDAGHGGHAGLLGGGDLVRKDHTVSGTDQR